MTRSWWVIVGYLLLLGPVAVSARPATTPSPSANLGATLQVSYKFRNGERLSDSQNGYICAQATDVSLVPTLEGHEVLTVHVADGGGGGVPGRSVSVTISGGILNFHFQGSPSTIEMTNLTDGNGDATFNFAAQVDLGPALLNIKVNEAGYSVDADGTSFKLVPEVLTRNTTFSILNGFVAFTPHGPDPAGSGPGQIHYDGGLQESIATSDGITSELDEGRISVNTTFRITENPPAANVHSLLLVRDHFVDQYREFARLRIKTMKGRIQREATDSADSGFRVEVQTQNLTGIPADFGYPAGGGNIFFGGHVPTGAIGKRFSFKPFIAEVGPASGPGSVVAEFSQTITVIFNIYTRVQASGAHAGASIEMDDRFAEIQAIPRRRADLFEP